MCFFPPTVFPLRTSQLNTFEQFVKTCVCKFDTKKTLEDEKSHQNFSSFDCSICQLSTLSPPHRSLRPRAWRWIQCPHYTIKKQRNKRIKTKRHISQEAHVSLKKRGNNILITHIWEQRTSEKNDEYVMSKQISFRRNCTYLKIMISIKSFK